MCTDLSNPALQRFMKNGSSWAIADQGIASAGNFATTLLLARGVPPAEYGTFVLLVSVCLVVFGFQGNLVVSPLVVLGASGTPGQTRSYLTAALVFTLALLPVSALIVLPAAISLHRVVTGIFALIYVVSWQLQETPRRALLSAFRYKDALWGDAISYLGQALLVGLLVIRKGATLNQAFALMAATSLVAAALQSWQARLAPTSWSILRDCGIKFWALGKWLVVVSILSIAEGPLSPWMLNWFRGRESAASFQAVMNVWGLANPILNSVSAIVIPATAAYLLTRENRTGKALIRLGMKYSLEFELILVPVFIVIALWPRAVLALFYGTNSVYAAQTLALRIGVIATIIYVPMTIFGAVLTGAGRTKTNASMHGAGAAASLVSSPPLIFLGGAAGAMLVEVVSRSARLVWAIRFLRSTSAAFLGDQKEVQDCASCTKLP